MSPQLFHKEQIGISRLKKILIIIASCFFALIVWLIYVMGGLRILLPYTPLITGFPFQTKNYILLLQNNTELRPGGGFISAYAIIRFFSGIPISFEMNDVFPLSDGEKEYIKAPYPMEEMLKSPYYTGWKFQDANWSADFPTNAEKLLWFYNRQYPFDIMDGVIAINYNVLESILGITGAINVDKKTFSRENTFAQLEYEVSNIDRHNKKDLQQRKNILSTFYNQLLTSVLLSPIQYEQFATTIVQHLKEKNIQLYFKNSWIQNIIKKRSWGGVLPSIQQGDFLGVVEANLGGMKSNRYIQRSVQYSVVIEPNTTTNTKITRAKVAISLRHTGDFNEPLSYTYRGFLRILIPKNSIVLAPQPSIVEGEELFYKTLGQQVTLDPQKETTLVFEYQLPPETITDNHYQLYLFKQSGTSDIYTVTVHTPIDYTLQGESWNLRDNIAFYQDTLRQDTTLSLSLTEDKRPPRITFQTFLNRNTIELHYNEPIDKKSCETIENYHITDANIINSTTDTIAITDIDCQNRGTIMTLRGVTHQPEERYQLMIQNVQDLHHNTIDPNPKTITVIQRLP